MEMYRLRLARGCCWPPSSLLRFEVLGESLTGLMASADAGVMAAMAGARSLLAAEGVLQQEGGPGLATLLAAAPGAAGRQDGRQAISASGQRGFGFGPSHGATTDGRACPVLAGCGAGAPGHCCT